MKDLDPFHPSYKVKRIQAEPIMKFLTEEAYAELYLDILQNEKSGLISVDLQFDSSLQGRYLMNLAEKYIPEAYPDNIKKIYNEFFRILLQEVLVKEIKQEIKDELKHNAENAVIRKCQEAYREILMTGPFNCEEIKADYNED